VRLLGECTPSRHAPAAQSQLQGNTTIQSCSTYFQLASHRPLRHRTDDAGSNLAPMIVDAPNCYNSIGRAACCALQANTRLSHFIRFVSQACYSNFLTITVLLPFPSSVGFMLIPLLPIYTSLQPSSSAYFGSCSFHTFQTPKPLVRQVCHHGRRFIFHNGHNSPVPTVSALPAPDA